MTNNFKKRFSNRGFTLIELLVVISIIGLLSSVVLASLKTARDKGTIAAGIKFSGYNYRAFGADAAGFWDFNDNLSDTSGNGNGGAYLPSGSPVYASPSYNNSGKFLNLSGNTNSSGNYVNVTYKANLVLTKGTIGLWLKNDATSQDIPAGEYKGLIIKSADYALFLYNNSVATGRKKELVAYSYGGTAGNRFSGVDLNDDKWHHVALTFTSGVANGAQLYIDGKPAGAAFTYTTASNGNGVTIGSDGNLRWLDGNIDDAFIYTNSLLASEIHDLYVQGLPEHTLVDAR